MFRVLTKNRIFIILSLCLSKIIKFEIELENISKDDLKDESTVFALPVDSASDLMALAIANSYQQIHSPLDKLSNSNLERFICLKDPKYNIYEQKIKNQKGNYEFSKLINQLLWFRILGTSLDNDDSSKFENTSIEEEKTIFLKEH